MKISSNLLNDGMERDVSAFLERKTLLWGAFVAGLALGFVAVYVVVAQPMFGELKELGRQTIMLQDDVRQLVGARDHAWEAGSLLSDLTALKTQLVDARATLREIKRLREDLLEESRHTASASAALHELARLNDAALEQQELNGPAAVAVEQMGRVHRQIIETAEHLPQSKAAIAELASLQSELAGHTQNLDSAKAQVGRMAALQDELAAHAPQSAAAFDNLEKLVDLQNRLAAETPRVAGAVQNLEILSEFQDEFMSQIASLGAMRERLTQVLLMETTIGRVVQALEPLAQIVNIRRLSDQELRDAARSILDNRATRLSSRPATPRQLPHTAEREALPPAAGDARYFDVPAELGAPADEPAAERSALFDDEHFLTN